MRGALGCLLLGCDMPFTDSDAKIVTARVEVEKAYKVTPLSLSRLQKERFPELLRRAAKEINKR